MIQTVLVLIVVNLIFGTGFPFAKVVLGYLDPKEWLFYRISVSAVILSVFFLRKRHLKNLPALGWLIVASLLGIVINQLSFVEGLYRTSIAHSSMINATIPLQTLFFSWLFARESMTAKKMTGILLGFAGVIWILMRGEWSNDGFQNLLHFYQPQGDFAFRGDWLIIINSISYSLYLVVARLYLKEGDPWLVFTVMMVIGVIPTGIYTHWPLSLGRILNAPHTVQLSMLYLIIMPSILAYSLNLWALKRVSSSVAALFVYIQPLCATLLGTFMIHEVPTPTFYVSALFILAGLVVSFNRREGA